MPRLSAQGERRQRAADKALASALSPSRANRPPSGPVLGGRSELDFSETELDALESAIVEAREAGNAQAKGQLAERLREAELRLSTYRVSGGALSAIPAPSPSSRHSHSLSPSLQQESPVERTLRKQRLAAKMGKR